MVATMTAEERIEYQTLLTAAKVEATFRGDERELDELRQLYELDQPSRSPTWYDFRLDELRASCVGVSYWNRA
jgi:hypothetical protein